MQEDRANYGRPRGPGHESGSRPDGSPTYGSGKGLSPSDERSWSALAHLSVLVWPVTGFLPAAPLAIWLVYRRRSPGVGFQALQSFWYQAAWAIALTIGWTIAGMLMIVLVGFLLLPFMALASLVPFAHQLYAAYKVNQGVDYRYPLIADMLDGDRAGR